MRICETWNLTCLRFFLKEDELSRLGEGLRQRTMDLMDLNWIGVRWLEHVHIHRWREMFAHDFRYSWYFWGSMLSTDCMLCHFESVFSFNQSKNRMSPWLKQIDHAWTCCMKSCTAYWCRTVMTGFGLLVGICSVLRFISLRVSCVRRRQKPIEDQQTNFVFHLFKKAERQRGLTV